jgi:hypothetical protein
MKVKQKTLDSRRNFLKASVVGTASLAIAGPMVKKARGADVNVRLINISQTPINQDIDNLRVAYITDAAMVRSSTWPGFATFNDPNNTTTGCVYSIVKANMDKLACALANKADAQQAWSTILKIPSNKTWATAKAAIKINGIGSATTSLHASVPILAKLIEVLMSKGMPAANITIFDMTQNVGAIYNNFKGDGKPIPAAVVFGGGGGDNVAVFPAGWKMNATKWLADCDIFINVANNKGHDQTDNYSGVTMCLKNNFGTVNFGHNGMDQLAAANSCDYVLGNIPTTYPAKAQLCIVDSLWLGNVGSWAGDASNNNNANSIVMGTFAGAVDYVATRLIRMPKLPGGINTGIVDQFLTKFGYTAADGTTITTKTTGPGKGLVDASTFQATPVTKESFALYKHGFVSFEVNYGNKMIHSNINFSKNDAIRSAQIFDIKGRLVRNLKIQNNFKVFWDGRAENGFLVDTGNYILKISGNKISVSESFVLTR